MTPAEADRMAIAPVPSDHTHPVRAGALWEILTYLIALAIGAGVLVASLRLDQADLRVPLYYGFDNDNSLGLLITRSTIEHGWYTNNPRLGAPGTGDLHDFPIIETGFFLAIKALHYVIDDWIVLFNVYYLISYPFCMVTSLFVLRHFKVSAPVAVAASLLFTFLPYHFWRGNWHLGLALYEFIPLGVMVSLWIARGDRLFLDRGPSGGLRIRPTGRGLAAALIVAAMAMTGIYYAFFLGFFLVISATIAFLRRPSLPRVIESAGLCLLLLAIGIAQAVPFVMYRREHGKNAKAVVRSLKDTRYFSLDLASLLAPTVGHRVPKLRLIERQSSDRPATEKQSSTDPVKEPIRARLEQIPETHMDSLGTIGTFGYLTLFLAILGLGTGALRRLPHLGTLAKLNVAATILAIRGGVGTVIAAFLLPEIRSYNRVAIFLAFFSLFAVSILADVPFRRAWARRRARVVGLLALVAATSLGLLDQIPGIIAPNYPKERATFESDRDFVKEIEQSVPAGSMVFQVPSMDYPEGDLLNGLGSYALLRPTFHSMSLRWSAGAVTGRAVATRTKKVAAMDVDPMLKELAADGFAGILVHRAGYEDSGRNLEASLTGKLGHGPIVSRDGALSFFAIPAQK